MYRIRSKINSCEQCITIGKCASGLKFHTFHAHVCTKLAGRVIKCS